MLPFLKQYSESKEYVVTLHNHADLDNFYQEMENKGKVSEFIPERDVACSLRRPSSRNTHYILTWLEAEDLKNDPRPKVYRSR